MGAVSLPGEGQLPWEWDGGDLVPAGSPPSRREDSQSCARRCERRVQQEK